MPRKAKPSDADFRGDGKPLLMERLNEGTAKLLMQAVEEAERRANVAEEPKRTGVRSMPIINFGDYKLDDIPELRILPAGSEVKLRILDVKLEPDTKGNLMLKLHTDIPGELMTKDVYWHCHFPKADMSEGRIFILKKELNSFCAAFEIDKEADNDTSDWLGKEGWAILGVESDEKYGDKNTVTRWMKQQ